MPIASFDHAVIPTDQPEEILAFYKQIGFTAVHEEAWRAGKTRLFSLAFGDSKINVHTPELWRDPAITLRGPTAVPGCGDFCFVWDGTVEEVQALFEAADAPIIEGPIEREGGRGLSSAVGTSLYTRDPDGNLIEFIVYPD